MEEFPAVVLVDADASVGNSEPARSKRNSVHCWLSNRWLFGGDWNIHGNNMVYSTLVYDYK